MDEITISDYHSGLQGMNGIRPFTLTTDHTKTPWVAYRLSLQGTHDTKEPRSIHRPISEYIFDFCRGYNTFVCEFGWNGSGDVIDSLRVMTGSGRGEGRGLWNIMLAANVPLESLPSITPPAHKETLLPTPIFGPTVQRRAASEHRP